MTSPEQVLTAIAACKNALFLSDPAVDRASLISKKGRRVSGTCEWIRDNAAYKSWLETDQSSLLWIRGGPGKGKTMLSIFLTEEFESITQDPKNALAVYYLQ